MKERFRHKKFSAEQETLIEHVNRIIESFASQGIPRNTLRTVYYGLVSEDLIPNTVPMYKKLGDIISDARLAGLIDWEAIVDLERKVHQPLHFESPKDFVDSLIHHYRHDRWADQDNYVEIWVEKNGMTVSIEPVTREWMVSLVANKGYGSMTNLYEGSKRFLQAADDGKDLHILYLGDHDPSGLDMDNDIAKRMEMFHVEDLNVQRVALTSRQVREYNPPPNPAKLSDSRATKYIAEFGPTSWEVNAISPTDLNAIIEDHLEGLIDRVRLEEVKRKEAEEKEWLRATVAKAIKERKH